MFSKTDRPKAMSYGASPMTSSSAKSAQTHQSHLRIPTKHCKPFSYGDFDSIVEDNKPYRLPNNLVSHRKPAFARQVPF